MRQRSHFPGHIVRDHHNSRTITLKEQKIPSQNGRTGPKTLLYPPKNSDPLQEQQTPSGTSGNPQEVQGRLEVRIGNPSATEKLLDGDLVKFIRRSGNHYTARLNKRVNGTVKNGAEPSRYFPDWT